MGCCCSCTCKEGRISNIVDKSKPLLIDDKWLNVSLEPIPESAPFFHGALLIGIRSFRKPSKPTFPEAFRPARVFIVVFAGANALLRTTTKTTRSEQFDEYGYKNIAQRIDFIRFCVFQDGIFQDPTYEAEVRLSSLVLLQDKKDPSEPTKSAGEINRTLKIGSGQFEGYQLEFSITYETIMDISLSLEIPHTYFRPVTGNSIVLYSNADVASDLGEVPYGTSNPPKIWKGRRCWKDLYESILRAKKFIYIASWSIWPELVLVRTEGEEGYGETLGNLLKRKAQDEQVDVRILSWEDPTTLITSVPFSGLEDGLMKTHVEESVECFNDSGVRFVKVRRVMDTVKWWSYGDLKCHVLTGGIFTHHQKCFVMDQDGQNVVTYEGGLDPTSGRYDDGTYSLFRSLKSKHSQDFWNECFDVTAETGPRQPWHDLHARIEGDAALDALQNFVERWNMQGDLTAPLRCSPGEFLSSEFKADASVWTMQTVRSIDSSSAIFDERMIKAHIADRSSRNEVSFTLSMERGAYVDDSFQKAYVHHIRRAREFLYIENQYFIGGSPNWEDDRDVSASNCVPMEIALKICQKIQEKSRFAAYIVTSLFPEGEGGHVAVQEQLHWMSNTVQMMYTRIAEELKRVGSTDSPSDYLNFYCLGNRETRVGSEATADADEDHADAAALSKSRRMQVYCHAKGMVVDDEVIMMGSANLNERSLNGMRDSELGFAAYQEDHLYKDSKEGPSLPDGDVHGFRLYLWTQHMKRNEECFKDPSSLKCVHTVNQIADETLKAYVGEEVVDLPCFWMKYPLKVDKDTGKVEPMFEFIPDTEAPMLGTRAGPVLDTQTVIPAATT